MGPFLADPMPSPRRFVWFGVGLAVAFAGSLLAAPEPAQKPVRPQLRGVSQCGERAAQAYVAIGPVSIAPEHAAYRTTITSAVRDSARHTWSVAEVGENHVQRDGFHIGTTLESLDTRTERDVNLDGEVKTIVVTCAVSVRVTAYPDKAFVKTAHAAARVTSPAYSDANELVVSRKACITAAVEDAFENVFARRWIAGTR